MTSVQEFDEPRVVIRARSEVGEGPVFDHRTGRLVWVDITRGDLFETDLATGDQRYDDSGDDARRRRSPAEGAWFRCGRLGRLRIRRRR